MLGYFFRKIKRMKFRDLAQLWKLPVALLASPFYRRRYKDMWLICEAPWEARDNGYWFFKYLRENHPDQQCLYVLKRDSPDYERISKLGEIIDYGSLLHWILYFVSSKKISSQKAGNPNAAIFHFLEIFGLIKNKRIFLQHGIVKNDLKWLYFDVTKFDIFICGAYPEYEYINSRFGYPGDHVKYTGLCRFDGLHDFEKDEKLILIMPTWREWIADEDARLFEYEGTRDIVKTKYFLTWSEFIEDQRLKNLAEKYDLTFVFFPHRQMQKYLKYFPQTKAHIKVAGAQEYDVQDLLKRASLMITDYSSVSFDFIYMKKPLIYYQFDYEMFRKGQYGEGYFDYRNNPFANSLDRKEDVFDEIEKYIEGNFAVSQDYLQAHAKYFRLYDKENCKRVYEIVLDL